VVVDDLHVEGVSGTPVEADPPLRVDPDGMLAATISPEGFESVSRGDPEVFERVRSVQEHELAESGPLKLGRKAL
jgi:hypothetical protein